MNPTKVRRLTASVMLLVLLLGSPWLGLKLKHLGHLAVNDWLHAFVLVHIVLLVAYAVYGPGRYFIRAPFAVAWALAIGFVLARLNLISTQGRVSLAAGAVLVAAGTLPSLSMMLFHCRRTGIRLSTGNACEVIDRRSNQISLRSIMILTAAFAIAGAVARAALFAPADPHGDNHDILVLHMWLAFFPCLIATPALIVVFRPSWKILLSVGFFLIVSCADPILLGLASPYIFESGNLVERLTWKGYPQVASESLIWHVHAIVATIVYALLARAAGFRMVVPDQSNDIKPNPSAQPDTEAGCDQD